MRGQMGIKIDGSVFLSNGSDLDYDTFIEKIESVGLNIGASLSPVDEERKNYELLDIPKWKIGKIVDNESKSI